MRTKQKKASNLRTPWDTILGTKSHVRVLRVLEGTRESMAVRELARRAGEHLRSVQLAVDRLVDAGVIERVGTGSQQQVQLNDQHPLVTSLQQLFEAERARFDRLIYELKVFAKKHAGRAPAIWLLEGVSPDGSGLEVGLMAPSSEVDALTDALRAPVAELARREHVSIEVRGWTRPDLEALAWSPLSDAGQTHLLWGVLPEPFAEAPSAVGRRSHAAADEALLERAKRAVVALERHPELVRKARDEVAKRLATAPPQESKTLREWEDVLNSMRLPQLRKWLVGRSERATRLRQSMPLVLLQAADQQPASARGKP